MVSRSKSSRGACAVTGFASAAIPFRHGCRGSHRRVSRHRLTRIDTPQLRQHVAHHCGLALHLNGPTFRMKELLRVDGKGGDDLLRHTKVEAQLHSSPRPQSDESEFGLPTSRWVSVSRSTPALTRGCSGSAAAREVAGFGGKYSGFLLLCGGIRSQLFWKDNSPTERLRRCPTSSFPVPLFGLPVGCLPA